MPKKAAATTVEQTINLPPLDLREIGIEVVGDSPLISHAWSAKAKKQILDKQTKKAKSRCIRIPRDAMPSGRKTGYKRSTRDAYLQRLQSRRLVEDVGRGEVRASSNLFSQ